MYEGPGITELEHDYFTVSLSNALARGVYRPNAGFDMNLRRECN